MMMKLIFVLSLTLFGSSIFCSKIQAQYVQAERDDTIRLFAKTPFDSIAAKKALAEGTGTIKGVAFTRTEDIGGGYTIGFGIRAGKKIKGNKITVILFPVNPYLLEYLEIKKKENPKKLKYAYINPTALRYCLTAVTNSDGEFTFPKMKPGKYYLEAILPYTESGTYNAYTGSGYGSYGGRIDYYQRKNYTNYYSDKLTEFVTIENDGQTIEVKLK